MYRVAAEKSEAGTWICSTPFLSKVCVCVCVLFRLGDCRCSNFITALDSGGVEMPRGCAAACRIAKSDCSALRICGTAFGVGSALMIFYWSGGEVRESVHRRALADLSNAGAAHAITTWAPT